MTLALAGFPYARAEGLGRQIKDHTGKKQVIIATLTAGLAAILIGGWRGPIVLAVAGGVTWLFARYTLKRIPGLTGDIYGALNEIVEMLVLLVLAAGVVA
jgi:adenosylcobinamide-GDP ribazoletransferase